MYQDINKVYKVRHYPYKEQGRYQLESVGSKRLKAAFDHERFDMLGREINAGFYPAWGQRDMTFTKSVTNCVGGCMMHM